MKLRSEGRIRAMLLARAKGVGGGAVSVGGSLSLARVKCGKSGCRCASDAEARHASHQLTWKENGRTRTQHVPLAMLEEVKRWSWERKRIKKALAEMDALAVELIRAFSAANRERGKNRGRRRK